MEKKRSTVSLRTSLGSFGWSGYETTRVQGTSGGVTNLVLVLLTLLLSNLVCCLRELQLLDGEFMQLLLVCNLLLVLFEFLLSLLQLDVQGVGAHLL